MENKKHFSCLVIFMGLLIICVYGYRLYFPTEPYYDEEHYVPFIRELFGGIYDQYQSQHMPLWFLMTAFVMKVFGDNSIAWRVVSLISGLLVLVVLYFLAKKITRNIQVALLAVFIMTFDCISLTQARISMMNSTLLLFMLLSILFFLYAKDDKKALGHKPLLISGIFLGLALSTKLVALNLWLFFIPLLLSKAIASKKHLGVLLAQVGLYLVLIPLIILFCTHLFIPFLKDRTFADIWKIEAFNLHYHLTMKDTHTYMSDWWGWPIIKRPIWFFFDAKDVASYYCIICIGNPVVFWSIPLGVGYTIWGFLRNKIHGAGLILLGFLTQWLWYMIVGRLKFFHYFYPSMPFVAMAMACLINDMFHKGKIGKIFAVIFLMMVVGMFVYWYPLLTGYPVSEKFYENHMWFRCWI